MRMMAAGAGTILAIVLLCAGPVGVVRAQATSASETALARRLFRQGIAASRAAEWEAARDAFQRSFDLAPQMTTLLNLAAAQSQTGLLVEASESYRRYLREATGRQVERRREIARAEMAELAGRIPHISIRIVGVRAGDRLSFDGDSLALAAMGEALPVNPGEHEVLVERDGVEPVRRSVVVAEAEHRDVEIELVAVPSPREAAAAAQAQTAGPLDGEGDDDEESSGVLGSPLFWGAVGAAVLGAVVVGVVVTSGGTAEDPFSGNVPPGRLILD